MKKEQLPPKLVYPNFSHEISRVEIIDKINEIIDYLEVQENSNNLKGGKKTNGFPKNTKRRSNGI